jgi:hypothetical protein
MTISKILSNQYQVNKIISQNNAITCLKIKRGNKKIITKEEENKVYHLLFQSQILNMKVKVIYRVRIM